MSIQVGTNHADSLTGSGGLDLLFGRGGADTLRIIGPMAFTPGVVTSVEKFVVVDGFLNFDHISGAGDLVSFNNFFDASGQPTTSGPGLTITVAETTGAGEPTQTQALGVHILGSSHDDSITGGSGDDFIDGGRGNDTIHGGDGSDRINGGTGLDLLTAGAGSDWLIGGAGNDTLYGGDGTNYALFSGKLGDYGVVHNGDGSYTVTDLRAGSPEGTDTLWNIEYIVYDHTSDSVFGHAYLLT